MLMLTMLTILLSSCYAHENTADSAEAAGETTHLSLAVEEKNGFAHIVIKNNANEINRPDLTIDIATLTLAKLTDNNNVRGLNAIFFDIGSGNDSISDLRLSNLKFSYDNAGNTISCNFSDIPLRGNLPTTFCTSLVDKGTGNTKNKSTGKSESWLGTSSSDNQDSKDMRERIAQEIHDLSAVDEFGMNLLHHAAATKENKKAIQFLLGQNIFNINTQNKFGNTALHLAAAFGDEEGVRLLASQPDINKTLRNENGHTACDIAIKKGLWQVAPHLQP